jgi:hypothetical protein
MLASRSPGSPAMSLWQRRPPAAVVGGAPGPHLLAVKRTQHLIAMNLMPAPAQDLIAAAGSGRLADLERR